ncbi:MAG: trimethylamine methyltransferase family protein, partial [Promethearchaeota archaeon]
RRSTWWKKGAKDIIERAREKVDKILEDHHPNELEKNVENALLKYMKKVQARTFDDYRKAEGLMVDSITLPDGIEIKEKK